MKRNQKITQLNGPQKDQLRKKQWLRQKKKCAILNKKIELSVASLDHKHKLKDQKAGPKGRGLCRGILHNNCNVVEGKITKAYKRYGLHKLISLPEYLRRLASYLENPPMQKLKKGYIHPSEKPAPKYLGKREYNLCVKYYFKMYPNRKKPLPAFKKKTKLGKFWTDLIKKTNAFKGV